MGLKGRSCEKMASRKAEMMKGLSQRHKDAAIKNKKIAP